MPDHLTRRDVAADITAKILNQLKAGIMPWRKPWDGARGGIALPRRITGENYRGVNVVLLWNAAHQRQFASPFWLTFNQAVKLGGSIRKGEKGETVVYYGAGRRLRGHENGESVEDVFRFLKYYVVFCADQIDHLPAHFYPGDQERISAPLDAHELWFAKLDIARITTRDTACYIPSKDVIGMPPLALFDTAEDYAATLNHECVHATMAPHRLARAMGKGDAAAAIAAEELVAEIGASFLGAHLHLPPAHLHDHAAYIGYWMKILASDKRAFMHAAAQAQAAVDWLLTKSPLPLSAIERDCDDAA